MNLKIEKYTDQLKRIPATGRHIVGQYDDETIIVYQAFRSSIAEYAVKHQQFGGNDYNFGRMSWIKPNFMWMMYRCGWAQKDEGQKHVLAIRIKRASFEDILRSAVYAAFEPGLYSSREEWKRKLPASDVRVQWDPDHDPYGKPLERKAIQLGLRGEVIKKFCTKDIISIEDITGFVKEQYTFVESRQLEKLNVPEENVYTTSIRI